MKREADNELGAPAKAAKLGEDEEQEEEEVERKEGKLEKGSTSPVKAEKTEPSADNSNNSNSNGSTRVFPLAPKRRVTVNTFKGMVLVDFREFYDDKSSGEEKHGKGISLTTQQYQSLKEHVPAITSFLDSLANSKSPSEASFSLGNKRKATVSKFKTALLVNLREFYVDNSSGEERPGAKGLALTADQYKSFVSQIAGIDAAVEAAEKEK